ncbi:MAG: hypothetical protein V3S55_08715 [Nitrospiraceae bacterium]
MNPAPGKRSLAAGARFAGQGAQVRAWGMKEQAMDVLVAVEVVAVLTAWGFLFLSVRRWGPGRRKRSVRCPEKKQRAKVLVEHREGDYGSVYAADVIACSLLPKEKPVTCEKKCLDRL